MDFSFHCVIAKMTFRGDWSLHFDMDWLEGAASHWCKIREDMIVEDKLYGLIVFYFKWGTRLLVKKHQIISLVSIMWWRKSPEEQSEKYKVSPIASKKYKIISDFWKAWHWFSSLTSQEKAEFFCSGNWNLISKMNPYHWNISYTKK